jgi:amino acid adenylation domain-containing protein
MTTAGEETIVDLFARQVGLRPDAVALSDGTRRITYAELDRLSTAVAARLVAKGVRPGDMVALCLDRSAGIVISQVAVLKAGATYVPLDASHPRERLDFMLEDTGAKVVLAQRAQAERALGGVAAEVLLLEEAMEASGAATAALPDPQLTPDSAAYVIFTSGSTGKPKGVLVTHRNVARLLSATHDWYKFDERDVWTLFHSYAFDFSVWEIWGALLYGGRVVVVPFQVSRSPREFYDLLADEGVTILNQTPAAFYNLIDVEENGHVRPLALREVIFGGEALNFKALRPWFARHGDTKPRLVNMYGITETTVHVTYRPVSKADTEGDPGSLIGVPIPDLAIYLLDEQGNPVADGEVGEIYVGGLGVARGYLNRAELTSERFLPDPFNPVAGARMYRSGDLARRTPEGDLEYHGRADMQVKVRGFRIELGEIEAAMLQVPGIRKVSVVADHDGSGSTRLVGFFVAEPQATVPQDAIVAKLKQLLPEYMVPVAFVPVASIPLTVNGKVDRASLLAAEKEQRSKRVQEAPATAAEGTLAGIVAEVLRLEKVGVTDNLFELGVDSLKIFQITSRAGKAGVAVTPRSVLQARTIRGALAMAAAAPAHSAASAIKPAARQRLRIDRGTGASPKA